jgi:hypothetical protein
MGAQNPEDSHDQPSTRLAIMSKAAAFKLRSNLLRSRRRLRRCLLRPRGPGRALRRQLAVLPRAQHRQKGPLSALRAHSMGRTKEPQKTRPMA